MNINELMATEVMGLESFETLFFHPTTDMNQAMECVEKYRPDSFEMKMCIDGHTGILFYRVYIGGVDAFYDSAPLAICKAILKAKGIDYERSHKT